MKTNRKDVQRKCKTTLAKLKNNEPNRELIKKLVEDTIDLKETGLILLKAIDIGGVSYALKTLRDLEHAEDPKEKLNIDKVLKYTTAISQAVCTCGYNTIFNMAIQGLLDKGCDLESLFKDVLFSNITIDVQIPILGQLTTLNKLNK